jgi:hypothetical protein
MKIKIWSQDNSDEENADEVEVFGELDEEQLWDVVEYQVKKYAEEDHPGSDYWDNAVFCVRVGDKLRTYDVEVQMEPTFFVAERKPKPVPA